MKMNLVRNTLTLAVLPLLLALLATSCGDKAAESQASSPQSSSNQTLQKREVDFFSTERRAAKTYYVKGEQKPYTGKIIGRFPDGKSMVEFFCQDGLVNGDVVDWHTNGQMKSKCSYKLGVKEGIAEVWADTVIWSLRDQLRGRDAQVGRRDACPTMSVLSSSRKWASSPQPSPPSDSPPRSALAQRGGGEGEAEQLAASLTFCWLHSVISNSNMFSEIGWSEALRTSARSS